MSSQPSVPPSDTEGPSQGADELFESEKQWVSRYDVLKAHGYLLRPRYRPAWVPSWRGKNISTYSCEDSILPLAVHLDAERISDGQQVFLKAVPKTSPEVEIGKFLSSPELRYNPRNHSIPLFDVVDDPAVPDGVILVLPLLRHLGEPRPESVRESLELVEQTLEGLVFLHEHQIAHRDCAFDNIMMDGRGLFPEGWHPQSLLSSRDGLHSAGRPALREVRDLRYYFIDFGLSTHGESMTLGEHGQEEAPELSSTVPYDPYKLDVYILGKAYGRFFVPRFGRKEFAFLLPLIIYMTPKLPHERPTAAQALQRFQELRASLSEAELARRLLPPQSESNTARMRIDIWHSFLEYLWEHWKTRRTVGPLE